LHLCFEQQARSPLVVWLTENKPISAFYNANSMRGLNSIVADGVNIPQG